jgi:hypothetical protein
MSDNPPARISDNAPCFLFHRDFRQTWAFRPRKRASDTVKIWTEAIRRLIELGLKKK